MTLAVAVLLAVNTQAMAQSRRTRTQQPPARPQQPQQRPPQQSQPPQRQVPQQQTPQGEQPPADAAPATGSMLLFREAYQKTRTAQQADEFTEIITLCERGLSSGGSETELKYGRDLLAWSYNERGERFANEGKEEEALSDFETSIKLDPTRYSAYHNRGVSYGVMGDFEAAFADFNKTLQLNPRHAKAYYNRGEVRFKAGDLDGAIADYTACLKLAPQDAAAYTSRAFAYASQNDYRNAISDYSKAIQADGRNAAAYTHRADAYADLGDFGRALNDYQAGVRADPKYARAHQGLAWLRSTCPVAQFRSPQFAQESAEKAIELEGEENYLLLDTLAAAQANAGRFDDAVANQSKAIARAPADGAMADEIEALQARLALYEKGEPYRTAPVAAPPAARAPVAQAPVGSAPGAQQRTPNRNSVQPRGRPSRGRSR